MLSELIPYTCAELRSSPDQTGGGRVLASIVGGLLLVSVISEMDLEPSAERTVLALIALAGIVAGSRISARQQVIPLVR
jgi:hypothetical protein